MIRVTNRQKARLIKLACKMYGKDYRKVMKETEDDHRCCGSDDGYSSFSDNLIVCIDVKPYSEDFVQITLNEGDWEEI